MRIICEHTSNFTARLIQFWMFVDAIVHVSIPKFTYNHALIEHNGFVYEAIGEGVVCWRVEDHYRQKKYNKPYKTKIYNLYLSDEELNNVLDYLNKQVGKKYEYANLLFHVLKTFTGWKGSKTDKKLYCYELVIKAMNKTKRFNLDPFMNPREFYNKVKKLI